MIPEVTSGSGGIVSDYPTVLLPEARDFRFLPSTFLEVINLILRKSRGVDKPAMRLRLYLCARFALPV